LVVCKIFRIFVETLKLKIMGTRGNIIIRQHKTGRIILNIYNHMDSYPSGLGYTLAEFLKNRVLVNGIGFNETRKVSNGIGCMAAELVSELKEDVGSVYIQAPINPLKDPNDYTYLIYPVTQKQVNEFNGKKFTYHRPTGEIRIVVYEWGEEIFHGTPDEFSSWV
jgi:hypothetical protein